ncbi:Dehydrogenase azaJ [Colletotrichum fructicola]|nr:Dehydrogenase azaJ [Colletotrichum fructicola]
MPHAAAVIPAATTPLVVQDVETTQPGSHELLIKNEFIALVPIDAKLAKLGVFPIPYPAILGTSYGGTVIAVGPNVTDFKVGDMVASAKTAGAEGNKFGAFQKQVIARDVTTSKLPASVDFSGPVGLIGNFSTVIGLFNEHLGLHKPDVHSKAPPNGKKILVYGGTSSFGSLSVQYLAQAGYDVVTTTSPRHKSLVAKLGAMKVIDHTQSSDAVIKALNAEGPYDYVVDSISLPDTIKITGGVLGAQGGGKIYALLPPFGPDDLPARVMREFGSWSASLGEEKNAGLLKWAFNTYFPQAIAENKLIPLPTQKIDGGLGALNEALDILNKGAIFDDGERLVLGSMGEAGVRRRVCHRALLLPDHADSEFVGILGQTIGQIGQEEISRLGMLHALFESKQSLKSADEEAPNHNMLAKHLWAETSAVFQGRWIWECDDWLKLDMLEDSGTPPSNYDPWISLPFIKHGLLSRVSFLFESVNMVGNSRRDYRCAVCGAPFRRPKIAKSSKSRGKAAGTQAPEEEYEGLDPAFFNHRSLDWLSEARVIGTHSHEGIGLNRAFVSEPGTVSSTRGFIMGEPEWGREENADVNTPHSNLSEFRCYHDPGQLDPVFPFHKSCYRILDSYAGSYNSDENRTDGIYDALYELSHNHDALALNLDYDTKIDNTFQNVFVPGIIAADPNARLFRMSFSIEGKIEKRYWDDLLLSTLLEPAEASPTDVFRSLPPEIVFYIISFMDLRSIFRSLKASPAVYELISNNFNFLKRQLTKHFPWYNDLNWYDDDLREYIVYGHPDLKGSDLMRVAFQLQEMPKLDNLDMISMANERRIHQVCKHIADKIQVRSEFRQQRQQKYMKDEDEAEDIEFEDDMYDWPFCSIKADSHCFQLSVVHGITNQRDRDLRSIYWAKSIEEFQHTRIFEAYFDDTLGLVGLSFAPFGETSVEIGPDRDVTGIVLHMTGTNPSAYENPFNELEMTSSAEAPPVVIPGLTLGPNWRRNHLSLELLTAPFINNETLDAEEAGSININPLAELLCKDSSALRWDRWIWQCNSFLWLNNLIPEITREVESNIFNNDIVPNELIAWIDAVGNVTLKRLSGWLAPTGSPLPAPENCGIPGRRDPRKYNLCGLRAELSSGDVETIGATEIIGACWPEEELVHFDVDVENGEEINEIGVASDAGDMPAMRTNRDREMLFARGSDLPDQWNVRQKIEIHGDLIYGVVMGFGQPSGWVITHGLGGAQESASRESPNSEFRASFAGMSYIGALTGFLEDGGSDEDEAGERGAERDSNDKDDGGDGLVGNLEEANEE